MKNIDTFTGILVPYTNFIIFIVLAVIFFRKPLAAAASGKRNSYLESAKKATQARKKAEQELSEAKAELEGLTDKIAKLKQDSKESAEREASLIIEQAKNMASHIEKEAQNKIRNEVEKAKQTLRREISVSVEKSLREKISGSFKDQTASSFLQGQTDRLKLINRT